MSTLHRLKGWLRNPKNHVSIQRDPLAYGGTGRTGRTFIKRQMFVTRNGISMSIQMSDLHNCTPGKSVEMWKCPPSPLLAAYGGGEDPYSYVPLEVVAGYIDSLESLGENHELHDNN